MPRGVDSHAAFSLAVARVSAPATAFLCRSGKMNSTCLDCRFCGFTMIGSRCMSPKTWRATVPGMRIATRRLVGPGFF